jgi:hypothetical protein
MELVPFQEAIAEGVKAIRSACGVSTEPVFVYLRALAEAAATRKLTDAHTDRSRSLQVAKHLSEIREIEHAFNLQNVIARAALHVKCGDKLSLPDPDWFKTFDGGANVSNSEMQEMWGRILAGELKSPGSFSRRSLAIVCELDQHAARSFAQLCRFKTPDDYLMVLPGAKYQGFQQEWSMMQLGEMESIGLITLSHAKPVQRVLDMSGKTTWRLVVGDRSVEFPLREAATTYHIETQSEREAMKLHGMEMTQVMGYVVLTRAGKEIANLVEPSPLDDAAFRAALWVFHMLHGMNSTSLYLPMLDKGIPPY